MASFADYLSGRPPQYRPPTSLLSGPMAPFMQYGTGGARTGAPTGVGGLNTVPLEGGSAVTPYNQRPTQGINQYTGAIDPNSELAKQLLRQRGARPPAPQFGFRQPGLPYMPQRWQQPQQNNQMGLLGGIPRYNGGLQPQMPIDGGYDGRTVFPKLTDRRTGGLNNLLRRRPLAY